MPVPRVSTRRKILDQDPFSHQQKDVQIISDYIDSSTPPPIHWRPQGPVGPIVSFLQSLGTLLKAGGGWVCTHFHINAGRRPGNRCYACDETEHSNLVDFFLQQSPSTVHSRLPPFSRQYQR